MSKTVSTRRVDGLVGTLGIEGISRSAFLIVGVIGLLLGGWSLIVPPRAPGVLLSAIACVSMGLWIRRAPRLSPTSGWVLVIAIGFFAIAVALIGFAVRDGINGDVGGLLINLVGAGAAIYVGVRGIGKARDMRRAQRPT
jgi:hypothetical protein